MTQRKMERISGWIAVGCWVLFSAIFGTTMYVAMSGARTPAEPVTSAPIGKAQPGKRTSTPAQHAQVAKRVPTDRELASQILMFPLAIAFGGACGATGWWRWRRRQRVRSEIRAEAYEHVRRTSRARDGRTARV